MSTAGIQSKAPVRTTAFITDRQLCEVLDQAFNSRIQAKSLGGSCRLAKATCRHSQIVTKMRPCGACDPSVNGIAKSIFVNTARSSHCFCVHFVHRKQMQHNLMQPFPTEAVRSVWLLAQRQRSQILIVVKQLKRIVSKRFHFSTCGAI